MRRRGLALFLVAIVLVAWLALGRGPRDETVVVRLGAHAARVREVDLHFVRGDAVVRDVTLSFPSGAPRELTRTVRLRPGDYEVAVRLVWEGGRESHLARTFATGGDEVLDLAP